MLITVDVVDEVIKKNVPELYQDAEKPVRIDGMDPHASYYLSGDIGSGKTHHAWAYYIWRTRVNTDIIGELAVRQKARQLMTGNGELHLINGTFRAYGQDLTIDKGRIHADLVVTAWSGPSGLFWTGILGAGGCHQLDTGIYQKRKE